MLKLLHLLAPLHSVFLNTRIFPIVGVAWSSCVRIPMDDHLRGFTQTQVLRRTPLSHGTTPGLSIATFTKIADAGFSCFLLFLTGLDFVDFWCQLMALGSDGSI